MKSQESECGYHFVNAYQSCMRKWFFRYCLCWKPMKTGKALIFGSAFHAACEFFYSKEGIGRQDFVNCWLNYLEVNQDLYEQTKDYFTDLHDAEIMGAAWYGAHAHKEVEPIAVEKEYKIDLGDGYFMTARVDVLLDSPQGVFALEHKSTRYSVDSMEKSLKLGDQVTVQELGILADAPDDMRWLGIVPDIVYTKGSVVRAEWKDPIRRLPEELMQFKTGAKAMLMEMTQKKTAWSRGYDAAALFPRNGQTCSLFGCEYENVCRGPDNVCPEGFCIDKGEES